MTKPILSKKMFPVSLMISGRSCLLVGGGRVAARKAGKLAASGAELTVVAPRISETMLSMQDIRLLEREFSESDLDGMFMVFALTDDSLLNQRIIKLCREKKILCSSADSNWPEGDLILPASFNAAGLTVAVGTAGRSCRRARLLKESLKRHVGFLHDADLLILGADYTSGFETIEKLKAGRAEAADLLASLWGIHEWMILDTCNRFEIVALVSNSTVSVLRTLLQKVSGISAQLAASQGMEAFCCLAETAAGLRAQAFGETRIVAQIKQALAEAQANGSAGSFLQGWTDTALNISKEIRQMAAGYTGVLETEDLVFQWVQENRPSAGNVLIIGRGEIGQGLARRFPGAVQISGRSEIEIRQHLPGSDVILCATGSSSFVLDEIHRPLLRRGAALIDLSMPRNIHPALSGAVGPDELRAAVISGHTGKVLAEARAIAESRRSEYERLVKFQ